MENNETQTDDACSTQVEKCARCERNATSFVMDSFYAGYTTDSEGNRHSIWLPYSRSAFCAEHRRKTIMYVPTQAMKDLLDKQYDELKDDWRKHYGACSVHTLTPAVEVRPEVCAAADHEYREDITSSASSEVDTGPVNSRPLYRHDEPYGREDD